MKRFVTIISLFVISLFVIPSIADITQSQSINLDEEEVVYQLPYPGLLPDHPLYFVKNIRDQVLLFTTRDNEKKAQLILQLSDKRMAAALALAEKGRERHAKDELMKAQDQFLRIPLLLKDIKDQGGSYSNDLTMRLYQSNKKHREVITEVMKKTTEGEIDTLDRLLKKNDEVKINLDSLQ